MNVQHLIEHFGSQQEAAAALGVSKQVVSYWKKEGIPTGRQYEIQVLTGGRLRVGMAHQTSQGPEAA